MADSHIKVDRDGFALAAYVSGRPDGAPWIVLSNSLAASHVMWEPQLPVLEPHYRVLRYDTRGHGRSDAPPGPYSVDDLVGDVVALMDRFGIGQADYMGLSLGGMTGLGLAVANPQRLRRLVCCDARAQATEDFAKAWDERVAAAEKDGMQAILASTMERWFTADFRAREPAVMRRIEEMMLGTSVVGYKGCAAALQTLNLTDSLPRIAVPTLYVAGADDPGTPAAGMRDMAQRTPGAEFVELTNAAHISNVNAPDAFNAAIASFLGLTSR